MITPLREDGRTDTTDAFRSAMAHLPTCVTVITTSGDTGPVGCTASAVISLSMDPPSMLISLAATSQTLRHIVEQRAFAVNALSWNQRTLTQQFASGDPRRRFDDVPHALRHGQPVLTHAATAVVCTVETVQQALDHVLVVGRVTWSGHRIEHTPLVYHQHRTHPGPSAS
ncbi:flavin reductase family protein [Streptomyces sp. NPDC006261]|uniref:flavin reductase family protein n=1 Tax=Streptomyces sp. NPDC006261 TaxID=3156739 RepID=UPI0033AAA816